MKSVSTINRLWDGTKLEFEDQVTVCISFEEATESVVVSVDAPFYNDPKPVPLNAASNFDGLWNFEVVEVFIKGKQDKYLEMEMGPHGQYLILACNGYRQCFVRGIEPVSYTANIEGSRWRGKLVIQSKLLPPVSAIVSSPFTFNAFSIHNKKGSDNERVHASLFPPPKASEDYRTPDFHKLELFKPLPLPWEFSSPYSSSLWVEEGPSISPRE